MADVRVILMQVHDGLFLVPQYSLVIDYVHGSVPGPRLGLPMIFQMEKLGLKQAMLLLTNGITWGWYPPNGSILCCRSMIIIELIHQLWLWQETRMWHSRMCCETIGTHGCHSWRQAECMWRCLRAITSSSSWYWLAKEVTGPSLGASFSGTC